LPVFFKKFQVIIRRKQPVGANSFALLSLAWLRVHFFASGYKYTPLCDISVF